jgi:hypothetical protein
LKKAYSGWSAPRTLVCHGVRNTGPALWGAWHVSLVMQMQPYYLKLFLQFKYYIIRYELVLYGICIQWLSIDEYCSWVEVLSQKRIIFI